MATDEEVVKAQERVDKLRAQVAEAEATRLERENAVTNDITLQNLKTEEARLEAELASAKADSRVTSVRSGATSPLAAAKEEMQAAVKLQQQVAKTATEPKVPASPAKADEKKADEEKGK